MPVNTNKPRTSDFKILETRSQNTNPLSLSEAAALFLSSFWKAQEEGKYMFCLTLVFLKGVYQYFIY